MSSITNRDTTTNSWKPSLCIDFDGVIHGYSKGWQGGVIYDLPVPGFFEWADKAKHYFKLEIFSTRSDCHKNAAPMRDWLGVNLWSWKMDHPDSTLIIDDFNFPYSKPKSMISIDDRCITFKGDWSAPELQPENLKAFRPWNDKEKVKP
jgi:hypothetical protein